jgi:hypothetical protein
MPAKCFHCGKTFKDRVKPSQTHLIKCELLHKSKNILNLEEDIPSSKKMFEMLLAMASEVNDLKKKVEKANTFIQKKIKKINIVETLNRQELPTVYPMHEMIRVESTDVEYLFQHTVFETIDKIFSRCIHISSSLPIIAFHQQINKLYGYMQVKETNEHQQQYKWNILTSSQITFFLENIQLKLSKELLEWKKENTLVTDEDDRKYDKTMSKLFTPKFKEESLIKKYRELFYERIKRDIMCQEYEFE